MTVIFELPGDVEQTLRGEFADVNQAAKEAALVELYRQHTLTHRQLATALALSRFDTDILLKRHGVNYELSLEDIQQESASLRPRSNT